MCKKFATLFVGLAILISCLIPAYAQAVEDLQAVIQAENQQKANAEEIRGVQNSLLDESQYKVLESGGDADKDMLISDYDISGIRKVYTSQPLPLMAFEETHSVDSVFSERHHWLIPVNGAEDEVAAFVERENGEMQLGMIEPKAGRYISDTELYEVISNSIPTNQIRAIKYLYAPLYHTTFAIIYTDSTTYCVPFAANEEFLEIKARKVYVAEEMFEKMCKIYDEEKLMENPDANGGVPLREHPHIMFFILVICSAAVIAASTYFLIRKKRTS